VYASGAAPGFLWRSPGRELRGSASGQFGAAGGIGTNGSTGDVYVADTTNFRVNEYDSFGVFVRSFGWGVASGRSEFESCGPGTSCRSGIEGAGAGQFAEMTGGVAVDSSGDVYVGDLKNFRVQKFNAQGEFLLMFGGGVDQTTGADVCTKANLEAGDLCGKGRQGLGNGEFDTGVIELPNFLAIDSSGSVFVGDVGRIQRFSAGGVYEASISLPPAMSNESVQSLAIDSSGDLYVTTSIGGGAEPKPTITKLSPAGSVLATIAEPQLPVAIATDAEDDLFVALEEESRKHREVIEYDAAGNEVIKPGDGFGSESGNFGEGGGLIRGLATNLVTDANASDVYVSSFAQAKSYVTGYGTAPTKWPPPLAAPAIAAEYAESVGPSEAVVGAEIDPKFWADTSYYVEYGTSACGVGGCGTTVPLPPGANLGSGVISKAVKTSGIELQGLLPGTTYHFRFVAQSTGSGGQPVRGTGGTVGSDGSEGRFTTPAGSALYTNCPNQPFRSGASARLTDCRAYEMVSPVDKNGSDIISLINIESNPARWDQAAVEGDKLTYSTSQGFGDPSGVPYVSQYLASRTSGGWVNSGISPTQGFSQLAIGKRIDSEFRAFTPDLCSAALIHWSDPPLAPEGSEGYANVNRRNYCQGGGYETVSTIQPPAGLPTHGEYEPEVQGLSADGRCVAFRAKEIGVYERCAGGETRPVSLRPDGSSAGGEASVGTANSASGQGIRFENDLGAISSNGSTIYWTEAGQGRGPLYVRENASEPQSAISGTKCVEVGKGCTVKITAKAGRFWAASSDGSRALVSIANGSGESLEEFDRATTKLTVIASSFTGFVGFGDDAEKAFFVSEAALGSVANPLDAAPVAGQPNLYFYDSTASAAEQIKFVGELSAEDARPVLGPSYSVVANEPFKHTARVSEDGSSVVFLSTHSLTGYENIDADTGSQDAEVFVYRASAGGGAGQLACVSCNPSGQRPLGRPLIYAKTPTTTLGAAFLQPPSDLYGSRVISADGSEVFFESYESLLANDVNGKADVYEWEAPGGSEANGACTTSASNFVAATGGCLSLISSGESATDSEFVDASANGQDVFFTTESSLVRQDPGLIDIYDARSLGGFPESSPVVPCSGESCQASQQVAPQPSPQTGAKGPGNPPRKCASGTRKVKKHGKSRCVKKKSLGKKKKHRGKHSERRRQSESAHHDGDRSGMAGNGGSK
jgi:hypothetical protein